MPRKTNADAEALGLDESLLVGARLADIERMLDPAIAVVILSHGKLPEGWPEEIRRRTEPDVIEFFCQNESGEWKSCMRFHGNGIDAAAPPIIPGILLTRRAIAGSGARVRPVFHLVFGPDDLCLQATQAAPAPPRDGSGAAPPDEPKGLDGAYAQRVGRALGLDPPQVAFALGEFDDDAGWRDEDRIVVEHEPRAVVALTDDTGGARIRLRLEADGSATAEPPGEGQLRMGFKIERSGLQFAFLDRDRDNVPLAVIDLYAGDLGLVLVDADLCARSVIGLLVASRSGRSAARSLPPGATAVLVLGAPLAEWVPAEDPRLRLSADASALRLVEPGGKERPALRGRVTHEPGAAHIVARIEFDDRATE